MLANKLMSALSGGAEDKLYSDSVFSAYTYTGNGSTQTINNGIDLAGKGGLVWSKSRGAPRDHSLFDTARGMALKLLTNLVTGNHAATTEVTSFNSNGYSLGESAQINLSGESVVSWTFRKAPKFFDVVTYTGNGVAGRQIPHSLGVAPGMVIVKKTSATGDWPVWHRSLSSNISGLHLNTTGAVNDYQYVFNGVSSTEFTVNNHVDANQSGATYVAYLFAHDTSTDGIIQCGTYTGNGSATGPIVNLGWEPQYLMIKNASGMGNWQIIDSMRGMPVGSADATLQANLTNTEDSVDYISPTATGFQITSTSSEVNTSGSNYIYLAIRRPNKPPTTGTEVYNAIARTGTGTAATVTGVGFAPDLYMGKNKSAGQNWLQIDRLRGGAVQLISDSASAEMSFTNVSNSSFFSTSADGVQVLTNTAINGSGAAHINHFFKRAPGFMDVVCYTGNGVSGRAVSHSLGVAPELMIVKRRSASDSWAVYPNNAGQHLLLEQTAGNSGTGLFWNSTAPTASVFSIGYNSIVNLSAATYVAYLFASLPGISKVGSYTGNGTTQTINCGFTTGSRFILIKRTDATGDWYVWDTARGIVAGNDPHLSLNTSAAEVTTDDSVDPDVSGFIVNQVAATNINVSGGSYIYFSVA